MGKTDLKKFLFPDSAIRTIICDCLSIKASLLHKVRQIHALIEKQHFIKRLCLASDNREFYMAALLASISTGTDIILPHSMSDNVIEEACRLLGADCILSDTQKISKGGLRVLAPEADSVCHDEIWQFSICRDSREPFLWLYTGGSTGNPVIWPKTVLNLFGEALFLKRYFGIGGDDVFLACVPPYHIYGLLFSVLLPFVSNAGVIETTPYFPQEIIDTAGHAGATVFVGSPMNYKSLFMKQFHLDKIRLSFSSGGFLDKGHSLSFTENTGTGVEEVYGSTETGGVASRSRFRGEDAFRPFPVVQWKIEEERLLVKSQFLSPGLNLNEDGFFKTGDRALYSGNSFELLGRVDNVVKVGGKRIELAALEQKIMAVADVKDVFLFRIDSTTGRESEIAGLIVTEKSIKDIKKLLKEILDPVELPRRLIKVEEIPVNRIGKHDKKKAFELFEKLLK